MKNLLSYKLQNPDLEASFCRQKLPIANSVRPSDQITLVAWDIVAVFSCYGLVPISLELQIIAATGISL